MKKSKKRLIAILVPVFILVFFAGIVGSMAVAGKLDLSGVPVVGEVVEKISASVTASAQDEDVSTLEQSEQEAAATDAMSVQNSAYMNVSAVTAANLYTSISDVTVAGGSIYAADETGMKVYKISPTGAIEKEYAAGGKVSSVHVESGKVYVLEGNLEGKVTVLDTNLVKTASIDVGHTPSDMVFKGTVAYVANRFSNTIAVINLSNNTVTTNISVDGREPMAMALAGDKIFVACHLPEDTMVAEVVSANVVVIDTVTNKAVKTIPLVNGAGGVKDICASPDGNSVYVSHIIARYAYPTTQLDRGWINTNGFTLIDVASQTATAAMMLDEVELGASNPWGVSVTPDSAKLVVAISGTDEVMIVDVAAMNAKINAVKNGNGVVSSVERISDYLPFLDGCRTRVKLTGKGARAIDIADNKAYIGLYFTGSIDVLDLSNNSISNISFKTQPANDEVREGMILFADANLCYQKWESCLSCHPDGLADGFNWDNLNDGLGNPKSAKSMLYAHRTPPSMATGIRDSAEIAVRAGMKYIQFNVLSETQLNCIDEYLKSLQPMQSPYLNRDGTLTESAARGKDLFTSQGCITCHPAPLFTDMKMHDVGTNDSAVSWENRPFDTPTLVEVWRTSSWMHDGKYNNMKDIVKKFKPSLTDTQATDLANYVLSIGDEGEKYGVEQVFVTNDGVITINGLVRGGSVGSLSVRRQKANAPTAAKVIVTLKKADGTQVSTVTKDVSISVTNSAELINLGNAINIPADFAAGGTLTIRITDAAGTAIATDLVLKY